MPRLKDEHKAFIVKALACFDAPSEARDALKKAFEVEATLSQIVHYDPGNRQGRDLGAKWKTLFEETRAAFIDHIAGVAAAHKAYRVRELAKAATEAKQMRNYRLMAQLYEQIAKEMGGAFTNRREVTGAGGGPVAVEGAGVVIVLPDNGRGEKPVKEGSIEAAGERS